MRVIVGARPARVLSRPEHYHPVRGVFNSSHAVTVIVGLSTSHGSQQLICIETRYNISRQIKTFLSCVMKNIHWRISSTHCGSRIEVIRYSGIVFFCDKPYARALLLSENNNNQ